jgi:hypothetical protein
MGKGRASLINGESIPPASTTVVPTQAATTTMTERGSTFGRTVTNDIDGKARSTQDLCYHLVPRIGRTVETWSLQQNMRVMADYRSARTSRVDRLVI